MMKTMKKYILVIATLLMLPIAAGAQVCIMGIECTGNTTITPSTSISNGILASGIITYDVSTHTVTLDGVRAHCLNSKEFISNRHNGGTLTVIVKSTCTITGKFVFDLDNQGSPESSTGNLIIKSGRADNGVVDLNLNVEHQPEGDTGNACAIIMGQHSGSGSYSCKLINLNINVSTQDGTRFFYGKQSNLSLDFYNCSVYVDNNKRLFYKFGSATLNIRCYGMIADAASVASPNSDLPLVIRREINTTGTTTTQIVTHTGESNTDYYNFEKSFSSTTTTTPVTQTITLADEINLPTGNNVKPSVTSVTNNTGDYVCLIPESDYTCTYPTSSNAIGSYNMTIVGIGNTTGSVTKPYYVINPYFTMASGVKYHATSLTTASVGASSGTAIDVGTTGALAIPASVSYDITTPVTASLNLSVTKVETGAFAGCNRMTGISLPATITSIGNGTFEGCTALRYIDLCDATAFVPITLERTVAASPFYGVPKQALVYLNGTTIKGENYVYKVGDNDFRCQAFKIYDDMGGNQKGFSEANGYQWAFENAHKFTAQTIVNTRKLTADQHYTTCLPYNLPIPAGMKAYTLSASSEKLLGFEEVTTGPLLAYHPYVIIPSTSGQPLGTTNVEIPAFTVTDAVAKEQGAVTGGNFNMYGTMRYIDGPDAEDFYIMQGKNNGVCTWMKVQSATSNTGANPVNPCVLPMRAYIKSETTLSREFMGSTFTNGISERVTTDLSDNDSLYDLQGRKVQTPQRRGVYIRNGSKVVIK